MGPVFVLLMSFRILSVRRYLYRGHLFVRLIVVFTVFILFLAVLLRVICGPLVLMFYIYLRFNVNGLYCNFLTPID